MRKYSFSPIALIIALVLGGLVEASYYRTMVSFGASGFFTRPIALVLLLLTFLSLFWPLVQKRFKKGGGIQA